MLSVLNGTVAMAQIHDFKFIVPGFSDAFESAESLSRNDYLLTVSLLVAGASTSGDTRQYRISMDFTKMSYEKYEFRTQARCENIYFEGGGTDTRRVERHTVFLGGKAIADFNEINRRLEIDDRGVTTGWTP